MYLNEKNVEKIKYYLERSGKDLEHARTFISQPFYKYNGMGFYKEELAYKNDNFFFLKDVYVLFKNKEGKIHEDYRGLYFFEAGTKIMSNLIKEHEDSNGHIRYIVPLKLFESYELIAYKDLYSIVIAEEKAINEMVKKNTSNSFRQELSKQEYKNTGPKLSELSTLTKEAKESLPFEPHAPGFELWEKQIIFSLFINIKTSNPNMQDEEAASRAVHSFECLSNKLN